MPRLKVQQKRMVDKARKNILDAVERNLAGLEHALSTDRTVAGRAECLCEECEVEKRCRDVLREASCVFMDTKNSFRSNHLATIRGRIEEILKEK